MESKERFYRRQFPLVDEVVMVKILSVTDLGATCCLLEYNEIEGFIASSDYSRKRIRSVKKLMRVGKQEVLQVSNAKEIFMLFEKVFARFSVLMKKRGMWIFRRSC
jgi:translation initiation factor 2 alpha subunit (eIF-2alpha)